MIVVSDGWRANAVAYNSVVGVLAVIVLILAILAIVHVCVSGQHGICGKVLWALFIFFFPVVGLICYCLCGRGHHRHAHAHAYYDPGKQPAAKPAAAEPAVSV